MLVSQWVVYMIYMSFLVINVTWAAKGGSKYTFSEFKLTNINILVQFTELCKILFI